MTNTHHELEMKAIAALRDAGYDAFYNFHMSSLARGVSVRVGKREHRIEWIAQDYVRTPAGFMYTETATGFEIHGGSVTDEQSAQGLIDFVVKLLGEAKAAVFVSDAAAIDADRHSTFGIDLAASAMVAQAKAPLLQSAVA